MQSSSKGEEEEEEKVETADKLHQQFLNLQQEWDNFKKLSSNSRSTPFLRSNHDQTNPTVQNSSNSTTLNLLDINTSPRSLMSSLQITSPSENMWKVNDSAAQEILRDRRDAIERGFLKGRRRLFEEDDDHDQAQEISEVGSVLSFDHDDDDDSDIGHDDDDRNDDDDPFGSGENADCFRENSCCLSGEKVGRKEEVAEKMSENKGGRSYYKVVMRWLAVVSVILAICIIRCFGKFHYENKVILVPT